MMPSITKPDVFAIPLQRYPQGGPRYTEPLLEFQNPKFQSLYVIRNLLLHQSFGNSLAQLNATKMTEQFNGHFRALAASGIQVPHWYVVGQTPEDLHVVTERIQPVKYGDVDPEIVLEQSQMAVDGLVRYLHGTSFGAPMLSDIFHYKQFVYGTNRVSDDPNFYMVDMDGYLRYKDESSVELYANGIGSFAEHVAARADLPSLRAYTVEKLMSIL